jgi:cysteine synthase A
LRLLAILVLAAAPPLTIHAADDPARVGFIDNVENEAKVVSDESAITAIIGTPVHLNDELRTRQGCPRLKRRQNRPRRGDCGVAMSICAGRWGFSRLPPRIERMEMHVSYRNGIIEAIGNTPLIKLKRSSEETGCTILGKAEFMNPGQSVKDRAALFIIRHALESGKLQPGGTVVEGTAGNTGIGLALVGNALGLKTVIVIPDTQSDEKKQMLRLAGAELIEVPAVPYKDPNNYVKYSGRLAEQLAATAPHGAVWANQFDNVANRQGHIETTAVEIWEETQGKVDGFVCAVGTGGTLAGVSMGLKAKNPDVIIGLADPMGASLYSYYKHGVLKSEGSSITEGIGQGRITANLEGAEIDEAYQIPDAEALPILFNLLSEEGLCLGGSSAINVAGAIRLARDMGPGHSIVTVLCDYGTRYQSKLFNPKFLREKGLPAPDWLNSREPAVPAAFV